MKDDQRPVNGARRSFFGSIAALGVASVGGALIYRHGTAGPEQSVKATPVASKGYSETDHIRKYYETARG